jgi:hypothetical protein
MGPKAVSIAQPTSSENVMLFFTNVSLTLAQIRSVVRGSSSPSITFTLRYGTDRSASGTEVVTGGTVCSNTTSGVATTSFTNATIPANNFVTLRTTASSGVVDELSVTLLFV